MNARIILPLLPAVALLGARQAVAHPGHEHAQDEVQAELGAGQGGGAVAQAALSAGRVTRRPVLVQFVEDSRATGHAEFAERNGFRYITADGLPDHETGRFPNRGNPNSIRAQDYDFRTPLVPKPVTGPRPFVGGWVFGIALNGVPFDPLTAEFFRGDRRSPWRYEAISPTVNLGLDQNLAHVQPSGAYHYHGLPTGLVNTAATKRDTKSEPTARGEASRPKPGSDMKLVLLGYAADGYPIYTPLGRRSLGEELKPLKSSYRLKSGARPAGASEPGGNYDGTFTLDFEYVAGSGDLDESNGFTGPTPEFPEGTYYYVLTEEFPFIPRFFRGEPDPSFQHAAARGGAGGPPQGPGMGPPPGPPGRPFGPPPPGRRPPRPPTF